MAEERMLNDEILLGLIKANSGGGGGGTNNYNDLSNKPQIEGVTLSGNKSASDLSLASTADLAGKVDKVEGYGLSENNYTDADKAIVGGVTAALAGKQDTMTFDDTPTDGSNNPVKSNGIYDALALKQNATDDSLDTTAKTIVGAINEHEGDIGELKSNISTLNDKLPANCRMLSAFGTTLVIHGSFLAVALIASTFGYGGKAGFYTYTANPDTLQTILDCGANITATYSAVDQTMTFTASTDVAWLAMFG